MTADGWKPLKVNNVIASKDDGVNKTVLGSHYSPTLETHHGKWWSFPEAAGFDDMFKDAAGDRRNGDGTLRPYQSRLWE